MIKDSDNELSLRLKNAIINFSYEEVKEILAKAFVYEKVEALIISIEIGQLILKNQTIIISIISLISDSIAYSDLEINLQIKLLEHLDKLEDTEIIEACKVLINKIEKLIDETIKMFQSFPSLKMNKIKSSDIERLYKTLPHTVLIAQKKNKFLILLNDYNILDYLVIEKENIEFSECHHCLKLLQKINKEFWQNPKAVYNLAEFLYSKYKFTDKYFQKLRYYSLVYNNKFIINRVFSYFNNSIKSFLTVSVDLVNEERILFVALELKKIEVVILLMQHPDVTFKAYNYQDLTFERCLAKSPKVFLKLLPTIVDNTTRSWDSFFREQKLVEAILNQININQYSSEVRLKLLNKSKENYRPVGYLVDMTWIKLQVYSFKEIALKLIINNSLEVNKFEYEILDSKTPPETISHNKGTYISI